MNDSRQVDYRSAKVISWVTVTLLGIMLFVGMASSFWPAFHRMFAPSEDLVLIPAVTVLALGAWNWILAAYLLTSDARLTPTQKRWWWIAMILLNILGSVLFVLLTSQRHEEE